MPYTPHNTSQTPKTHSNYVPGQPLIPRLRRVPRTKRFIRLLIPALLLCCFAFPRQVSAQGLELAGGWQYINGSNGNGFNVGAGWFFTNHVQIAAGYDSTWKDMTIGTFQVTQIGLVTSKTHLQNWLIGPRIFFYNGEVHKRRFDAFGEVQFGGSHTNTKLELTSMPNISTSDNCFSWTLGGGAEYAITRHWRARGNVDLLRTHFANTGQSRLRVGLGVAYTFGTREK
jgi:opacity protein-like surface antigen